MAAPPGTHPPADSLRAFAAGRLDARTAAGIMNHLDGCPECCRAVVAQSGDDFLDRLRQAHNLLSISAASPPVAGEEPTVLPASAETSSPVEPARSQSGGVLELTGSHQRPLPDKIQELCLCLATAQSPDELGRLGPYRVLQVLGAGGMGVVYRAEDPQLKRPVALKALLPTLGASESARKRFLREAQAAAAISHDNIVHIYQVGEDRGVPFMAMQYLDGESLEACLKRQRRLSTAEVLRIGRETAEGLAAAHERGLIHRDIKPANLWLEGPKRRVKILDFGIARSARDEAHLTQTGAIIGTPAYMAPEQASARPVDPRSDLFSLGCVLYRLATGEMPFKGKDTISILAALALEDPPAPVLRNPQVPPALSNLIMRLLQKDPAKRPASAHEVIEKLTAIERSLGHESSRPAASAETPVPAPPTLARRMRLNRRIAALIAAAVVLLGGIVIAALIILRTPDGDYVIETDDPDFVFQVNKDGGVTLEDRKTKRAYQMKVLRRGKGEFDLQVADDAEQVFETKTFTIKRGEKVRLKAWFARKQDAAAPASQGPASTVAADDWMKEVAAMPSDRQVKAVMDKLKQLNPGFDGKETHTFDADGDAVIELHFCTDKVADISPVRALTRLQKLKCAGTENWKIKPQGKLYSLGALKGLKLTWLDCSFNGQLSSLGPLKGMPLIELHCNVTKLSDLSPLEGMPLEVLDLMVQPLISDLSPLAHTRLRKLILEGSPVRDLSPLRKLPLTELHVTWSQFSDLTPLRDVRSLQVLNIGETQVNDLRPLEGLRLAHLFCIHTPISDLTPLKRMPLVQLDITGTRVTDLSLLGDMPLKTLHCDFNPDRDNEILRSIKTLATLNGKPVEHVLGVSDAWVKQVSAKPGHEQLKAVMDKLKELNPGFDGKEAHAFDEAGEAVIELHFCTDKVSNISPVRGLTGLQKLRCAGSYIPDAGPTGQLSSLRPLVGMPLLELFCSETKVSDLSPLKGMKLRGLWCKQRLAPDSVYVSDLSPLEGMPLEVLDIGYQPRIADLSPLAHTRLRELFVGYTRVRDLTPLKGLCLEYLGILGTKVSDLTPLANMQSLRRLDIVEAPVKDLSALKGLRLTHLRAAYAPIETLTPLKGMKLETLNIAHTKIADLSPLEGMPLVKLWCNHTSVADPTPLRGMPLEFLEISQTKIADLSLLKDMPLKKLWCDFKPERDAAILRSIKTLETINDKPAKALLK